MKNNAILKIALASSLVISASFALADGHGMSDAGKAYVRADAGFAMLATNPGKEDYSKKPKGSPVYGVGFGYKFTDHLRSDVTITHRSNFKYSGKNPGGFLESQKISSTAIMLNAYYDIMQYKGFTPYVMAGAGMAYNKAGDFKVSSATNTVTTKGTQKGSSAWQAGLGTQYKITKNVNLDVGYRYVSLGKISTTGEEHTSAGSTVGDKINGKLRSHELLCGVSYSF